MKKSAPRSTSESPLDAGRLVMRVRIARRRSSQLEWHQRLGDADAARTALSSRLQWHQHLGDADAARAPVVVLRQHAALSSRLQWHQHLGDAEAHQQGQASDAAPSGIAAMRVVDLQLTA